MIMSMPSCYFILGDRDVRLPCVERNAVDEGDLCGLNGLFNVEII